MVTLKNTTKSVKVLKAWGMPTLRLIPGFNYVDVDAAGMKKYTKSDVNKAIIKESILKIDGDLSGEDDKEAKAALSKNKELNKAQKIIKSQNEQILAKDKNSDEQARMIKEQSDLIVEMTARLEKLEKGK